MAINLFVSMQVNGEIAGAERRLVVDRLVYLAEKMWRTLDG